MMVKAVGVLSLALLLLTPAAAAAVASAAEIGPGERVECLMRNNVWEGENGLECVI